jgi:hypothetical protein
MFQKVCISWRCSWNFIHKVLDDERQERPPVRPEVPSAILVCQMLVNETRQW